jgi:hypothetical protein
MKKCLVIALTGITLFAALAIPAQLIAQEQSGLQLLQKHPTHYKVVFIGTFGGQTATFLLGERAF